MEKRGEESIVAAEELPSVLVAAHELKAPLVLMKQLTHELSAEPGHDQVTLERLRLTIERSLRLVEQLTRASRVDDMLFDTEPLQVGSIIYSVVWEMTPLARSLGQQLETRIPYHKTPLVVGHRGMLEALLINLCDNALEHNSPGSMVALSASHHKNAISFHVRDNGPKMSLQYFSRLSQTVGAKTFPVSDRARSSGLGLWIADQFTKAMHGELTVQRHREGGVTFSVKLPYSQQISLL